MKRNFFRVRFSGEYFSPVVINGKDLTVCNSVKILDVEISAILKWNDDTLEREESR